MDKKINILIFSIIILAVVIFAMFIKSCNSNSQAIEMLDRYIESAELKIDSLQNQLVIFEEAIDSLLKKENIIIIKHDEKIKILENTNNIDSLIDRFWEHYGTNF